MYVLRSLPVPVRTISAILLLCAASGPSAAAPYKLQPGDVVSFSVAAIPNLSKDLTVSAEGVVNVPLIGWTNASGLTIRELEEEVRKAVPNAIYRQRANGDELLVVVRADEVSLEVIKYRPVYVSGEVGDGGEQAYRPDMTVRQLIALAGGLKPSSANATDEQLRRLAALKSEYGSLMADYIAALSDLTRLKAEISGETTVSPAALATAELTEETVTSIVAEAQRRVAAQSALDISERAYLDQAIQQNGQRVAVLREQQRQEQEGVNADSAELERVQTLASQGSVQQTRVTEARRQLLLSSTRALETKAELATAELRQADLIRQLGRMGENKKVTDLQDVHRADNQVARLRAQLQGIAQEVALSTPVVSGTGAVAAALFSIYRSDGTVVKGDIAGLETRLQPGDVVEVYGVVLPSTLPAPSLDGLPPAE